MTFLYLNSNQMGVGDSVLGRKLLKSFLSELAKSDVTIDVIGCVNSAIELTTEGSDLLDILAQLESKGAKIASCGTCLDHYGKREQLKIGAIGTMDMTVAIMAAAAKVIKPC